MQVKKIFGKILDVLILISSFLIIAGLLYAGFTLIGNIVPFIRTAITLNDGLYYSSMLIGVLGGLMFWLQMWINAADKAAKSLRAPVNKQEVSH